MDLFFSLIVIACSNPICHYVMPPTNYKSEEQCRINAAMIAGMKRADNFVASGSPFTYEYECHPVVQVSQAPLNDSGGTK
ncbi:hypothetical protein [Magnetospira sp. QH-2]|uniref:hypothetical protein n=1 Tax=Magnetospira sp. (strain QH-2) TaxID=1288970 RepID=UPI0003E81478|nr:hypothetical protein [Magnetospira sp. QH-2]CCQ74197.1 Protein of unknown function [Magnetospira sp. QH-2]